MGSKFFPIKDFFQKESKNEPAHNKTSLSPLEFPSYVYVHVLESH